MQDFWMKKFKPSDTATAWTQLITIVFSSMRDGYYDAIKQRRQSSMKRSVQSTVDFRGTTNSTTKAIQDTKVRVQVLFFLNLEIFTSVIMEFFSICAILDSFDLLKSI